jgi:type IV pilus assembly protein PilC
MPTYAYRALNKGAHLTSGTIVAPTRREALQRLVDEGKSPIDLSEQQAETASRGTGFRLGKRRIRLATFNRQLATLSASGSPILKGLSVLSEQTKDAGTRQVLSEVMESVRGGNTLADALKAHPADFPELMTSMIRIGETGGTLDQQLLQLSELYEKEETLKGEVQAALAYPALVLLMGVLSAVILVAFFIPRLETIFTEGGAALPLPTRILLGLSHFITGHGLLLALALAGAGFGIHQALKQEPIRLGFDRFKLAVPWLGDTIQNLEIARFTRLLGTLTRAGISIVDALRIVHPVLQNKAIAGAISEMVTRISTGTRLATLMRDSGLFPPLAIQMVATGEETGHLDDMLMSVADTYDRETAAATKVMLSMLAPLLILVVAAIVGFILVSMILPIFKLSTVMG